MTKWRRLTPREFSKIAPLLDGKFQPRSIALAKAVLLNGKTLIEASEEVADTWPDKKTMSIQSASRVINRIWAVYASYLKGLEDAEMFNVDP